MSTEIIQQRLKSYHYNTILDQENALKEIAQEIALMSLSRSGFFDIAGFQGGTCLRILYGLNRFSEDLDFVLEKPNPAFNWEIYIKNMKDDFKTYGYILDTVNKMNADKIIKTAFLKAESEGGVLIIHDARTNKPKLQIKLEVDSNPPQDAQFELKYLDFPSVYSVKCQTLPSLFASKCHALLCRPYVKGRDWYDFIWYIAQDIPVNYPLLSHALAQSGPWKNNIPTLVDATWVSQALRACIERIDWDQAKQDVARFLNPTEVQSLRHWNTAFFLSRVDKFLKTATSAAR